MKAITVVDYDVGNLASIGNMLKKLNIEHRIAESVDAVAEAEKLILPGVGAYDHAMKRLRSTGLFEVLDRRVREDKTPLLGICLGLQLLTNGSEEGDQAGFGWIDAYTRRLDRSGTNGEGLKIPHMGWNEIHVKRQSALLDGLESNARFYFVHSYGVYAESAEDVLAETFHGGYFHSVVGRGNVMGAQFHPEKSHKFGMRLLANFAEHW